MLRGLPANDPRCCRTCGWPVKGSPSRPASCRRCMSLSLRTVRSSRLRCTLAATTSRMRFADPNAVRDLRAPLTSGSREGRAGTVLAVGRLGNLSHGKADFHVRVCQGVSQASRVDRLQFSGLPTECAEDGLCLIANEERSASAATFVPPPAASRPQRPRGATADQRQGGIFCGGMALPVIVTAKSIGSCTIAGAALFVAAVAGFQLKRPANPRFGC